MDLKERYLTLLKSIREILKNENQMHISSIKKKMDIILEDCINLENEISKEKEWEVGGDGGGLTEEEKQEINNNLSELKSLIDFNSSQIDEIENNEVRKETLNSAVENYVNTAIDDGKMANLTIKDNSIEGIKIKDKQITKNKLNDKVSELIDVKSVDESYLYAIADSKKRVAFGIKKDGAVEILTKLITDSLNLNTLNNQQIIEDTLDNYLMAGTIDKTGKIAENAIGKDGRVPEWVLQAWANRFPITKKFRENLNKALCITCWGDSLTQGAGSNGRGYPVVLQELTGLTVYNAGVGGESSNTIACRQGGLRIIINNVVIPGDCSKVKIGDYNTLKDNFGNIVRPLRQGGGGIDECTIDGVECLFTATQTSVTSDDIEYFLQRKNPGEEIKIVRPTPLIGKWSEERKDDINIIFIGQNGGWNKNIDTLVFQQKSMIKHLNHGKYIIISNPLFSNETLNFGVNREALELRMLNEYGRRYINIREYMVNYGLEDANIKATEQDLTDIKNGEIPSSLRVDNVHGKPIYYEIIAKLIYKRLKELKFI